MRRLIRALGERGQAFLPRLYNLGTGAHVARQLDGIAYRLLPDGSLQAGPFGGALPARFDGGAAQTNQRAAIDYYAKAFQINHSLLDVRVNPRILDSKLVAIALLRPIQNDHARQSMSSSPPLRDTFRKDSRRRNRSCASARCLRAARGSNRMFA